MIEINETFVNATKGQRYEETGYYETRFDNRGNLFRALQQEYGGCQSAMYRDVPRPDAAHSPFPAVPIADRREMDAELCGWVFGRHETYDDARPGDANRTYMREVWVEVREAPDPEPDSDIEAG